MVHKTYVHFSVFSPAGKEIASSSVTNNTQRGFTLIELLVVIAIIALLMAILMPALQRGRKQARTVACLSNLKQWSLIFNMYTDEHNGHFHKGLERGHHWTVVMKPYYGDNKKIFYCPTAKRHIEEVGQWGNDTAWIEDTDRSGTPVWPDWMKRFKDY